MYSETRTAFSHVWTWGVQAESPHVSDEANYKVPVTPDTNGNSWLHPSSFQRFQRFKNVKFTEKLSRVLLLNLGILQHQVLLLL